MKNNNNVMSRAENIQWLSIIALGLFSLYLDYGYLQILINWVLIIILLGNARRFYSDKNPKLFQFIRRSFYVFPLFIPIMFKHDSVFYASSNLILWILVGLIIGGAFVSIKLNEWRLLLSNDYLVLTKVSENSHHFTMIFILLGAAIGEELFFRYFIIQSINDEGVILGIFTSAFLFFLFHYGVKWASDFSKVDFIIQFTFGLLSATLFVLSGTIFPSIVAHLIFNLPHVIFHYKKIMMNKENLSKERSGVHG
ncbi:CPBP family intramembrane glutamic endopeptidase [Lysinibacillus xylanilyticus]|uniref:CPBP family intramembrane glutamic endopeptidase n=1 Tax=Lysinibacillus xylanilyticus TaxID=582475 RepID=UPI003D00A5AA